jgi:hypothetical protein
LFGCGVVQSAAAPVVAILTGTWPPAPAFSSGLTLVTTSIGRGTVAWTRPATRRATAALVSPFGPLLFKILAHGLPAIDVSVKKRIPLILGEFGEFAHVVVHVLTELFSHGAKHFPAFRFGYGFPQLPQLLHDVAALGTVQVFVHHLVGQLLRLIDEWRLPRIERPSQRAANNEQQE